MTNGKFKVGYLDSPPHPAFLEAMKNASDIDLVRISTDGDPADVTKALADCEGYYVQAARDELPLIWHVTEEFLSQMPKLLVVSSYGAGYDTVDTKACTRYGVAACNQAGGNAEAVSQQALAYILSLLKRIPEGDYAVREGTALERNRFMGRELFGRTVGLVGFGHIGSRTAHYLNAFNCRVLAFDPYVDEKTCTEGGAEKVDLDTLLSESDIVSLHCPLTAETRNMFSADAYAKMRGGAIFVTTARGGIHDEVALFDALSSGHLAGAGVDVWTQEPPPVDHPLLTHPAVIATSHTSGVTNESRTRVTQMAAETFIETARRNLPPRIVNPDGTEAFKKRLAAATW